MIKNVRSLIISKLGYGNQFRSGERQSPKQSSDRAASQSALSCDSARRTHTNWAPSPHRQPGDRRPLLPEEVDTCWRTAASGWTRAGTSEQRAQGGKREEGPVRTMHTPPPISRRAACRCAVSGFLAGWLLCFNHRSALAVLFQTGISIPIIFVFS